MMNRDFVEMLSALRDAGAEYLVVGAHALAAHRRPRATGDLDLWVRPTPANARRVYTALKTSRSRGTVAQRPLLAPPPGLRTACPASAGATSASGCVSRPSIRPICPFASPTSLISAPTKSFAPALSFFPTVTKSLTHAAAAAGDSGGSWLTPEGRRLSASTAPATSAGSHRSNNGSSSASSA